jgi:hypothetical protein
MMYDVLSSKKQITGKMGENDFEQGWMALTNQLYLTRGRFCPAFMFSRLK